MEAPAGADNCFRGVGRGRAFVRGADFVSKLCCFCAEPFLFVGDELLFDFSFVANGNGAGLSG